MKRVHQRLHSTATASAGLTATRGNQLFRRWLWLWPCLGLLVTAAISLWVRSRLESVITAKLGSELNSLLQANVTATRLWLDAHVADAQAVAGDPDILTPACGLLELAHREDATAKDFLVSPHLAALRETLRPLMESHDYADFTLIAPNRRLIASGIDQLIGGTAGTNLAPTLEKVLAGSTCVTAPFPSRLMIPDAQGVRCRQYITFTPSLVGEGELCNSIRHESETE